ncbi:synaptosomal-associated protein 29 isoform X1 [Silurus meridionalis]|uniref:synaptosomal-associated protein 29 isoform X1 n=1 Tax=Silurus meridionalis TaxID=175797 RepID=UPI001EECC969|nr:synaptosomal-associated protein 29 isoform X1 [Silurus meridionalis]XP_046726845.1 synaptosomal-associated protein 29 isoform X1 [Silurus meridionalis]
MYPNFHNPFANDNEEHATTAAKSFNYDKDDKDESTMNPEDRHQRHLEQEVMRTAQSAMESSSRSLSLIYDSEKIGRETAEELICQGEALKRTEKMVDNMTQNMKTSQKNINSIKSVWGGLVNYFKGNSETRSPQKEQLPVYEASSRLQTALADSREHEDKYEAIHPSLRKLDPIGFRASFDNGSSQNGHSKNRHLKAAHQHLDNNLDEMSKGLSRLKNLGLGLQSEIDDHDVLLDTLQNKVDSMESKISSSNRQLKNLK